MRKPKAILYFAEGLIAAIPFFTVLYCFKTGMLVRGGRLTDLWSIPMVFLGAALLLMRFDEEVTKIPWWIPFLLSKFAAGAWLGLSLEAVLVLNKWYADPATGSWEPLFTATSLSATGMLAAERWFAKILKRVESIQGESHS